MIWRATVDKHHAALAAELGDQVEAELGRARESGARQTTESLNQAIRRLRQAPAEVATLRAACDTSAPWAEKLVVVAVQSNQFLVANARGAGALTTDMVLENAPALEACRDSKDPMTVLCSEGEMGSELSGALGAGVRIWLFPVLARGAMALILVAAGEVVPSAMELLAEAIGLRLESQRAPVVRLRAPGSAWEDLSAEDQSQHLLAQRVARLRVAEMRLAEPARLEKAVFAGNIYDAFREAINRAREEFLTRHLVKSHTMVDYLHLELLRSLAHDDERLLGADYPGPLA